MKVSIEINDAVAQKIYADMMKDPKVDRHWTVEEIVRAKAETLLRWFAEGWITFGRK